MIGKSRRAALVATLVALIAGGCGGGRTTAPAAPSASARLVVSPPSAAPAPAAPPLPTAVPAAAMSEEDEEDREPLVGEERDRDPRSATIKVKVIIDPRRKAHVWWGRKDFGEAPLEIERPRDSGPLDLIVLAPGYLPHHARAFTDRDDKLSVRTYTSVEAPQLPGYRADQDITQNRAENRTKSGSRSRLEKK